MCMHIMATMEAVIDSENSEDSSFGSPGSPPSTPSDETAATGSSRQRRMSRPNTLQEIRSMTRARKEKRKARKRKAKVQEKKEGILYKQMAHDYWDRWKWEHQQRKEEKQCRYPELSSTMHQIDSAYLLDPQPSVEGGPTDIYLGTGSFSIVQLKIYRGMQVAVKQFRSGSLKDDVINEAKILMGLCHPNLPYIFGVCTTSRPYSLVMQFHGIGNETVTIFRELYDRKQLSDSKEWLILCSQLMSAVEYLHHSAHLLHNDIKGDNVLLTDAVMVNPSVSNHQVVLIDFGKATPIHSGRLYRLSEDEIQQHLRKHTHLAPEVLHGQTKQTEVSDVYSIGILLSKIISCSCFSHLSGTQNDALLELCATCKAMEPQLRPTEQCSKKLREILSNSLK